jgi:hypothetical protein
MVVHHSGENKVTGATVRSLSRHESTPLSAPYSGVKVQGANFHPRLEAGAISVSPETSNPSIQGTVATVNGSNPTARVAS